MSGGATDVMRFCYAAILPFILFLPAAEALAETVNTRILNRAVELLPDESHWNRADTRECPPHAPTVSLYCAVRQATEEVLGLWPLGVVLVFELLSGFLAIECPIDRDAISVGSPVPGAGFRPENPDLAESALPQT